MLPSLNGICVGICHFHFPLQRILLKSSCAREIKLLSSIKYYMHYTGKMETRRRRGRLYGPGEDKKTIIITLGNQGQLKGEAQEAACIPGFVNA